LSPYARVAFLPDTFHEVNGVAHTSRQLQKFVQRRQIPFLSIHAGPENLRETDGVVTVVQIARGPARFGLDANLDYDPFLLRHARRIEAEFAQFKPDLIHLTGPGDMGTLGMYLSSRMKIPLVISWHTSLHEYAGRRLERIAGFLGQGTSQKLGAAAERWSLWFLGAFYRRAVMVMAPNQELLDLTRAMTHKPAHLMRRGVDTVLFDPAKRLRPRAGALRIGYVGRLTPEKNVRFLANLAKGLVAQGVNDFEFVLVGEGSEESWLRTNVPNATLTGVLRGEPLSQAFADMDLFAFPSLTDTFGNVILEALASGVPCIVTTGGGPKFLVKEGVTGFVAATDTDFVRYAANLARDREQLRQMSAAARQDALNQSWDAVFDEVFQAYASCLPQSQAA
jgi:glycosyltransferase involved in cell wall biosynthesis